MRKMPYHEHQVELTHRSLSMGLPSFLLASINQAQLAQHIANPIQLYAGILKPAMIGNRNAALGINKNDVVRGLVALVSANVLQKTAQLPTPPHNTINQWKKTSRK